MDSLQVLRRRAMRILALAAAVLAAGTIGYRILSDGQSSWLDCLYMVVITVTTIGYGETVPLDHNPAGRVFTMFVALFGVGIITYVIGTVTQMAADGNLQRYWRRRRMQREIDGLSGHYVVCGWSILVPPILRELQATQRPVVVVLSDPAVLTAEMGGEAPALVLQGDPADETVLRQAGADRAVGVFAAEEADYINIVIAMAARSLRADLRIVSGLRDARNLAKLKRAGVDAVVNPVQIGALRMSSEMVRPSVVSFLDTMLRDRNKNLRIEEIPVGAAWAGRTVADGGFDRYASSVLLALRRGADWTFKPVAAHVLAAGDVLVFMTNPEERTRLEEALR